jgi:Fe2+ or Zn2+ uptake regulation protein
VDGFQADVKERSDLTMKSIEERLEWGVRSLERSGTRMTSMRAAILEYLAAHRKPVNLDAISQARGVKGECDATTVYRTLMVLKDTGLVRCVGMLRKTSHFVLEVPDDVAHFLICERCGAVEELELSPSVLSAMERLAVEHGFAASGQSMDLHGVCRACEEAARKTVPAAKVMARYCVV